MKYIVLIFFLVVNIFARIINIDESEVSQNLLGTKNLKGAKFLGEKIWQDQEVNEKINFKTLSQAKEYCKNLTLLGIKKWELPSLTDFLILDEDKNKLTYIAKGCDGFGYCSKNNEYYTKTKEKGKTYIADLDNGNIPYIRKTKFVNEKRAVRCVLNPNVYNKFQKQKANNFLKENSLEGYLQAFLATKNKSYFKKALKMAKTPSDYAKIEEALFKFLGFFKVFEVKANGEVIGKLNNLDTNNRLLAGMIKSKSLKYKFTIQPKKNAPIKLKYNTYNVTLEFNLKLKYHMVNFGIGTTKRKFLRKEVSFTLSPKNNYTANIEVDFGKIDQAVKTRFLILNSSSKLEKASLIYNVKNIQIKRKK